MFVLSRLIVLCFTVTIVYQKIANSAPVSSPEPSSLSAERFERRDTVNPSHERDLSRLRRENQAARQAVLDSIVKMENRQRQDRAQASKLMGGGGVNAPKHKQTVHVYQPDSREKAPNSVVLGLQTSFKG
ncbi:uncharacterized protein FA14DRAFT_181688 [Meira miltonrushii]|uniref:Uncharacterized protein n=1 Tax=Meira miltonrushii TaxID=1280837 RepID=A0A316V755_9BASI|nr:uncharacterized protein FA14DRAFT_181688 [Meira miltonrushii]PWN33024.1 hypothetical protein FA14DRAFT_181688 [Meira miltonrushii]